MNFTQIVFAVAEAGAEAAASVGFWQMIKNGFIFFLEWLYNMTVAMGVPSFVLAIFLFTLVVRVVTQPLMNKQMRSSRKMQMLAPEVEQLKKRYAANPQKLQQEQMKLYKENGASPTAGCLPLLIQMPIIYALFSALRNYVPAPGIDFSFMWIPDLGQPDTGIILPLLAAGATFLQQWVMTANRQDRMQRMMMLMMPVMFFFMVRQFQALLALYWIFYSLIGAAIFYPVLKKWEREDRRKIEELRRQKAEEEEARRAKKAAARDAAKRGKGKKQSAPGYAVEEDDFIDEPDEDDPDAEDDGAEQDPEKLFRRYLAEEGIKSKKKKMRLHPYSLEEEVVEIAVMPEGKERNLSDVRREWNALRMRQQQQASLPQLPNLGSLFGKGKKRGPDAGASPAAEARDSAAAPAEAQAEQGAEGAEGAEGADSGKQE